APFLVKLIRILPYFPKKNNELQFGFNGIIPASAANRGISIPKTISPSAMSTPMQPVLARTFDR
ncbi:hypothetical protein, partial [Ruegeria sp. HKCCSP346]|uniref:hypothetical protein n=1 Tax=Ruegeria sp. HKCCSP346 TaxID=2794830 RepID=UPI001AE7523A